MRDEVGFAPAGQAETQEVVAAPHEVGFDRQLPPDLVGHDSSLAGGQVLRWRWILRCNTRENAHSPSWWAAASRGAAGAARATNSE
jgi:hypothetical protein